MASSRIAAEQAQSFPWKPALAGATVFASLLLWHRFENPTTGLYPSIFADAFRVQLRHAAPAAPKTHAKSILLSGAKPEKIATGGARPPISPYLIDDSGSLDPFFVSLHDLEAGQTKVVRVLHYGDSPTTADLITADVRAMLQARFGDAGHGFNLIAKPWAWYGHRDVSISDHGWKSLTGVGSMRKGVYGIGGARFEGDTGAKTTYKLADAAQTDVELEFLPEPDGGTVTVSSDDAFLSTVGTRGEVNQPASKIIHLPPGAKEVTFTANGPVTLLGVDFRRGDRGVIYDSLGLNGASTTVLSRAFDPVTWAAELQHAAPALVVINYGTNESSFGSFVDKQYEGELRIAIARVRKALPVTPILIMSPMDRGERAGLNQIETMATIPRIVAIQQKVAADLHCAFFDTFDAMGGSGTMSDWYAGKPRLVSADLIHPTPQGALIVAQELIDNLNLGYARWEKLQGISAKRPIGSQACRPVGKAEAGKAIASLAPAGTIGVSAEPIPSTGSVQTPALPCPPNPRPNKTKAADERSELAPDGPSRRDTEKNDRSTSGKAPPAPAPPF